MTPNDFAPAFSTAFIAPEGTEPPPEPTTPPIPAVAGLCYPDTTDWGCAYTAEEIAELDPVVMARSEALAWSTLSSLTGYQIAVCPIQVRPCTDKCVQGTWTEAPLGVGPAGFRPGINAQGYWVNSCGCGHGDDCSCTVLSEIILPGPVGGIVEMLLDGDVVDPGRYRVDNGNRVVAQWDMEFPACQDMRLPATELCTFAVTYWRGFPPNALTNYAAGVLAVEFYKACTNQKGCRLPSGVTSVTRQGVSMEIQTGMFTGGVTGIREVDAIIQTYNPYGLKMPAVVTSPDVGGTRTPTWRW